MKVLLADSYGWCFGVRDAVALALRAGKEGPLTVLGELVHNPAVLRQLEAVGIQRQAPGAPLPRSGAIMITAHGAAVSRVAMLRDQGLAVVDGTCPLVAHAHRMLARLVGDGYFPVVVGLANHEEVRGLVADLNACVVVSGPEEVAKVPEFPLLGVISQTTQPLEVGLAVADALRSRFPASQVQFVDTVCAPTRERQRAARRLGATCEVVVVVGGRGSNNSRHLARACEAEGARAYLVEGPEQLDPGWFAGVQVVGLTAGTSTPAESVEAVRRALEEMSAPPCATCT